MKTIAADDRALVTGGDGSAGAPFQDIATAVDASLGGDEIVLRDGVYVGHKNRGILLNDKRITVRSEHGPANCVINPQGSIFAFRVAPFSGSSVVSGVRIKGITFLNCNDLYGAAISFYRAVASVVRNCRFENCTSLFFGGAVSSVSSDVAR